MGHLPASGRGESRPPFTRCPFRSVARGDYACVPIGSILHFGYAFKRFPTIRTGWCVRNAGNGSPVRTSEASVRVLGVDPGMALLGYGVVEGGEPLRALSFGVVSTPAHLPVERRLVVLHDELAQLLEHWQPDVVALEQLFFARNVTTALAVGQARGIVLLLCGQRTIPVVEYTPAQVKQAVGGYGRARKREMQEMVRLLLRLPVLPQPDDAADALALAVCYFQYSRAAQLERFT